MVLLRLYNSYTDLLNSYKAVCICPGGYSANAKKVGILQTVMNVALPKYTNKDYVVLAIILLPYTLITNSIAFGVKYFSSLEIFLLATITTAIAFSIYFTLCGGVAVLLKNRFSLPHHGTKAPDIDDPHVPVDVWFVFIVSFQNV
jgi:hypothetical protein